MKNDREFTLRAVVIGLILSLAMAAANMYLGLKVGITISANIPCSVIALILFHALTRTRSIAEVNLSQATGSVGEGLAAGVVFVFPALVLSGAFKPFASWGLAEYASVTLAVLAGSILGIVLTGFLRRPMVVESKELKYPEGVATAEILKTGMAAFGEGRREGIRSVVLAFCGGFAVKLCSSGVAVLQETVSGAFRLGNAAFRLGSDVSAALVGVGFIIEFNGAVLVALGGALAWFFFIPLFTAFQPSVGAPDAAAAAMWASKVRYIGVGGMAVGGLWSIIQIRRQLAAGIQSALAGLKGTHHAAQTSREPQNFDLQQGTTWFFIAAGILISAAVYFFNVGPLGAGIATLYTVLAVFFFVAISVYIVGLIGSTNQPVSGITICTFLLAALFLFVGRVAGVEAVRTILFISGVVCLAACLSGTAVAKLQNGPDRRRHSPCASDRTDPCRNRYITACGPADGIPRQSIRHRDRQTPRSPGQHVCRHGERLVHGRLEPALEHDRSGRGAFGRIDTAWSLFEKTRIGIRRQPDGSGRGDLSSVHNDASHIAGRDCPSSGH